MKAFQYGALALAVSLTACGGSSSSDRDQAPVSSTPSEKGVFVDSAVAGINYATSPGGMSGKTNALGEYNYVEGDTVTFSIGGTSLPPVTATGRVTPADMSDDLDVVTNILQLLQSLDDDGDPSNGINIPAAAHTTLTGVSLDVTGASGDFDALAEVALGEALVIGEQALEHFVSTQSSALHGSWIFVEPAGESSNGQGPNGEEVNVLTFMPYPSPEAPANMGLYFVAHKYGNDDQGAATVEFGGYSWDPISGSLETEVYNESDSAVEGEGGGFNGVSETMKLVGGELHLGSEAGAETPFMAVKDSGNPYVGAWLLVDMLEERIDILTILDSNDYVVVHDYNLEAYGDDSVIYAASEWGTYSISGGELQVTGNASETDGPGGLFDASNEGVPGATAGISVSAYGDLTLEFAEDDAVSFMRAGPFAVDLYDLSGKSSTVEVERIPGFFPPIGGFSFAFQMVGEDLDENGEDDISALQLDEMGGGLIDLCVGHTG